MFYLHVTILYQMHKVLSTLFFCLFLSLTVNAQKNKAAPGTFSDPVEVAPSYPGGVNAFIKFIDKNLAYPKAARRNCTHGKVIVSFIVERYGKLTNFKVVRSLGDGCDEEALRLVKLSSPWKPSMQNGETVRSAYALPINFTLPDYYNKN